MMNRMKFKQFPYLTWIFIAAVALLAYANFRDGTHIARKCPQRKIYIDGGANLANSLFMFENALGNISTNALPYWEIYSFEASKELAAYTQFVADGLNRGESLDVMRKLVLWNSTLDACFADNDENQFFTVCDPLIRDWHYSTIQPLIDSYNDKASGLVPASNHRCNQGLTKRNTFKVINAAMCDASTKHLQFQFSFSNYFNGGSNGMNLDTHSGGEKRSYTVPCISIAQWLMDNFREEDYVILKLDIEGAEYMVMNDLLYSGAMRYIDELMVEWHSRFPSVQQYLELEKVIKWIVESHGIIWHNHAKRKL